MSVRTAKVRTCTTTGKEVELCFQTFGASSNPPLLMVMGLNGSMMAWDPEMCQTFADRGFYVIRFDNRDVGQSTKFDEFKTPAAIKLTLPKFFWGATPPYSLDDMAADAVALLDALNIDQKVNVVGISMGGMIAQVMALNYPERVKSLTSIMSTTGATNLPGAPWKIKKWFLKAPKSGSREDLLSFRLEANKHMLCTGKPACEKFLKSRIEDSLDHSMYRVGVVRQMGAIVSAPNREEQLRELQVPSLVLHGDKDYLVPVEHGYRTAAVIPNAKLVVLPDQGHYLLPDCYGTVMDEIVAIANK